MNACRLTTLVLPLLWSFLQAVAFADFKPVSVRVQDHTYWVGQRVPFFVELRAKGTFSGAASFSLPQLPRAVILKVGNPVVSSEKSGGDSIFVQTHEFALFSQKSGTVEVPAFEVRFHYHQGFAGPVKDQVAHAPASSIRIKRPPGSSDHDYLVTTSSLKITETWEPQPGSTRPGAIFHRTITQEANELSGMALAPPPESALDGIRAYAQSPEVTDRTERGAFRGRRIDRITYTMQSPGVWTLPAIKYVWWDPQKGRFGSMTLPATSFEVAALPASETVEEPWGQSRCWAIGLSLGVVFTALVVWQRRRVMHCVQQAWRSWNPPERNASRRLLRACHRNDPKAAETSWLEWENWQAADFQPTPSLRAAVIDLQGHLYGQRRPTAWRGTELARAFREQRATNSPFAASRTAKLPKLNPATFAEKLLAAFTIVVVLGVAQSRAADPLPSWNDTDVKKAIVSFVGTVTTDGSPRFVPPADRIVTFDNDGTLWAEQPMYFQLFFVLDRVKALAPQHPEWTTKEPFVSILKGDIRSALAGGDRAILQLVMATHAGMTTGQFEKLVKDWIATAKHPITKRPFTEMVYQPMLELLVYLRANKFKTFIVSGGGVEFMRPWAEQVYGIPPEQVVGSSVKMKYEIANGKPVLLRLPEIDFIDDKEGKPVGIQKFIGRRPIAAFGNSDGDLQMLQWTTADGSPRLAVIIHHTDADREWAYDRESHVGRLDKALIEANRRGWIVVDMKRDWKCVFPWEKARAGLSFRGVVPSEIAAGDELP